jgi:hypothetical protein
MWGCAWRVTPELVDAEYRPDRVMANDGATVSVVT